MYQVRQGDILIEDASSRSPWTIPDDSEIPVLEEGPIVTLLEGEATGHAHQVKVRKEGEKATLFEHNGQRYIRVPEGGADLIHPEHGTIPFDTPGVYAVTRQSIFSGQSGSGRVNVSD